jgi:two-component system sensor histidine kinase UhpB
MTATEQILRVLILEDTPDDAELVLRALRRGGFAPVWERVETPEDFSAALQREWDIILSDFKMPRFNAYGALEILGARREFLPVIVVSGTIGEEAAVGLLKSGASDFIVKDQLARLVPAVRREIEEVTSRRIRHEAERTAHENQERYRILFDASPLPMWVYDPKTLEFLSVNEAAVEHYGFSREEFATMTVADIRPDAEREAFLAEIRRRTPDAKYTMHDKTHRKKDGRTIDVEVDSRGIQIEGRWVRLVVAHDVTEKKQAESRLRRSQEQLRALAARLQRIREEERTGIARELHDELGQALTAIKMDLAWIRDRATSEAAPNGEPIARKVGSATGMVDEMIGTVRRISSDLRPGVLDDLGLMAAIDGLAQAFRERNGISCRVQAVPESVDLDRSRATAVFRILQEALTNVSRHSGATEVEISIGRKNGHLEFQVRDNGRGFPLPLIEEASSLGLIGMRERANSIGGRLTFASGKGEGTTVRLRLPVSPTEEA